MPNVLHFPSEKLRERRDARNVIAALVNSTGCQDEISQRLAKLVEAMDLNNYKIAKLERKQCETQK